MSLTTISQASGDTKWLWSGSRHKIVKATFRPHFTLPTVDLHIFLLELIIWRMDVKMPPKVPALSKPQHLPLDLPFLKHPQEWAFKLLYEWVHKTWEASTIQKAVNHMLVGVQFHDPFLCKGPGRGHNSVVERMPSTCEAHSSVSSTWKKKTERTIPCTS